MPIDFEIYPDLRIVLTVLSGVVEDQMCIDNIRRLVDHSDFDSSFDQVIDTTEITRNALTEDGLREVASSTPFSPGSRRAFIVAENILVTQADIYSRLTEAEPGKVFVTPSREKAYAWLLE